MLLPAVLQGIGQTPLSPFSTLASGKCPPGIPAMEQPASLPVSTAGEHKGYGIAFDIGYVTFPLLTPRTRTTLHPFQEPMVVAGAGMPDGNIITFTYSATSSGAIVMEQMASLDPSTGKFTSIAALPEGYPTILDATYEPVSGKLLALAAWGGDKLPSLVSVDTTTAAITVLRRLENVWYSLAADGAGRVFFVDQRNGALGVSMNPFDGREPVPVARGNSSGAAYISSMAMDRDAYMLYWAMCSSDGRTYLMQINPAGGATANVGTVGASGVSKEIMALHIPVSDPASGTPSAPRNLTVATADKGALTATASWTNPSTGADTLVLYLNGRLFTTLTGAAPSETSTTELSGLTQGYNHLRVATASVTGRGEYADAYFWAGRDVPAAVTDLKAERLAPDSAVISWTPSASSVHGGYVSPTNIKYRITRYSMAGDTTVVQKTFRGTEYRERIEVPGSYRYSVQALSTDYGETAFTGNLYLGAPMTIPYNCDFSTLKSYTLWTPYSANGNSRCWTYYSSKPQHIYNPPFSKGNDDWIFSAPLNLEKGKDYYIHMLVRTGLGEYYPKMFEVTVGRKAEPSAQTVVRRDTIASKAYEEIRVTVTPQESGEYYMAVHDYSPFVSCNLYIYEVSVTEKTTGRIRGRVTDPQGRPVEGVEISIDRTTLKGYTDAAGNYDIDYVDPGTYSLTAIKGGYAPYSSPAPVNVVSKGTVTCDFVMSPVSRATVSGIVTDDNNAPVAGVNISISDNMLSYEAVSGADGRYTLTDIPVGDYRLEASRLRFATTRTTIGVKGDMEFPVAVTPLVLPPHSVTGTVNDGGEVNLNWQSPRALFRRDNGVPKSQNGAMVGNQYYLFGSVWRQPATISAISWMTTEYQGPHNWMNLWLLDIKPDGTPSPKVLYSALHVPAAGDNVWNRHEIAEPVNCPNGFYIAVSYDGMASIAMSDGEDADWPFVPGVNYRSKDYRTDEWTCVDASFVKNNYMLRAEGEGTGEAPDTYAYRYSVWRLAAGDSGDASKWTLLTPPEGVAQTAFSDNPASIEDGDYRYAVATLYPGGKTSDPVFSPSWHLTGGVAVPGLDGVCPTPNPVISTLHLGTTVDCVAVYDLAGCLRIQGKDTDAVDMSALAPGCYLLKVTLGSRPAVFKIIKK